MMNSAWSEDGHQGIDRLSELSDEILVHILSFLPIRDVRTVCIRRFGNLWRSLPSLRLDGLDLISLQSYDIDHYADVVRNVLILHNRALLDKFSLPVFRQPLFKEIPTWIGFAIGRQVKELSLILPADIVDSIVLPQGLFTSQSLVKLDLFGFRIYEPSQVQMGSLKTLSLRSVNIAIEVINKIISGSPSLQKMCLDGVSGLNELRFIAPNIQELELTNYYGLLDCPNLKILDLYLVSPRGNTHLELVDVSSVQEVCITLRHSFHVFYDLMKKFCNAEVFKYSDICLQSSEFKKLEFLQTTWKRLHIVSQLDGDRFLGICYVLRSSPRLEELTLVNSQCIVPRLDWAKIDVQDVTLDTNMLSLELPPCLMGQLKRVTLRGYQVLCQGLLRLIEVLLKNSVALEEMVILPSNEPAAVVDVLAFVKQLSNFPRASTNARVIIGSEHYTIMQDQEAGVIR